MQGATFLAGVGSGLSGGAGGALARAIGADSEIDQCSDTYSAGEIAGATAAVVISGGGMASTFRAPAVLYHFTSRAAAADIASSGMIRAGAGLYGRGVYLTRWNIGVVARIQGAASTEVSIAVQTAGRTILPTTLSGTLRESGNLIL